MCVCVHKPILNLPVEFFPNIVLYGLMWAIILTHKRMVCWNNEENQKTAFKMKYTPDPLQILGERKKKVRF